jgi:glycopeptide antibiotics resistance protein
MTRRSHRLAVALGLGYFVALACIVFWPSPVDRPVDHSLFETIGWVRSLGIPPWLFSYNVIEFTANILMFAPFGIIVALRMPRRLWWVAVMAGALASAAVELSQGLFLAQRDASWSDIVANTAGAAVGALAVLGARARLRRKQEPAGTSV